MKDKIKKFFNNDLFSYCAVILAVFVWLSFFLVSLSLRNILIIIVLSTVSGFILIYACPKHIWDRVLIYLYFLTSPALIFILAQLVNYGFFNINIPDRILNYIFILILFLALRLFIPRFYISATIGNIVILLWAVANYYVTEFRGKPILPWDLTAFSTALQVAGGYQFHITIRIIFSVIIVILWAFLLKCMEGKAPKVKAKIMIPSIIIAVIILTVSAFNSSTFRSLGTKGWDTEIAETFREQGIFATFIKYAMTMNVSPPEGYSVEGLRTWAENYESKIQENNSIQPQIIIMVMNESLADMSVLGDSLTESYMPFWDSLSENTIKGNLYVSVRGGGTCNTEWESLTGDSMLFLPTGVYPFESYINHDSYSLASYLKNLGYITEGVHFAKPGNWRRDQVYPYLGFQEFYSVNDFEEKKNLRGATLDSDNYNEIIKLYEKSSGQKQFIYNVTIQNHGGYEDIDDLEITVDLSEYGDYPAAETYFSLIRLSDQALESLISYFQTIEEPTMIIVYGDHQPSLGNDIDNWLSQGKESTPEIRLDKYITPFFIWTNYDSGSAYIDKISANYFPSLILKVGNFDLPIFNQYLLDVYKKYPVLSRGGILDSEGNYYASLEDVNDTDGLLSRYAQIQYNNMFDSKNLIELLYD